MTAAVPPGRLRQVHARPAIRGGSIRATSIALVLLAACSGTSPDNGSVALPRSSEPTVTRPAPTTTQPPLPTPPPWVPSPAEPAPDSKTLASAVVQTIGTYPVGGGTTEAARTRLQAAGLPPELADATPSLLIPGVSSAAEIVYPQLGGLTDSAASVMVVTRFRTRGTGGEEDEVTRVLDVRLERTDGPWSAAGVASDGGAPPPTPVEPTPAVSAVLENDRIELPDSAVWDLESGLVDSRIADLLLALAAEHQLRVAVFATGHPVNVFATDRQSNHTAGRGVDIWSIDGTPVADQQDSPTLRAVVESSLALGVTEIGAPFDIDGPGGRVFTNTVHLDHLHLAFRST